MTTPFSICDADTAMTSQGFCTGVYFKPEKSWSSGSPLNETDSKRFRFYVSNYIQIIILKRDSASYNKNVLKTLWLSGKDREIQTRCFEFFPLATYQEVVPNSFLSGHKRKNCDSTANENTNATKVALRYTTVCGRVVHSPSWTNHSSRKACCTHLTCGSILPVIMTSRRQSGRFGHCTVNSSRHSVPRESRAFKCRLICKRIFRSLPFANRMFTSQYVKICLVSWLFTTSILKHNGRVMPWYEAKPKSSERSICLWLNIGTIFLWQGLSYQTDYSINSKELLSSQ